ncbi:MAG: hypothetical protein ACXVJE_19365 [Mucilaginibacter sp.]
MKIVNQDTTENAVQVDNLTSEESFFNAVKECYEAGEITLKRAWQYKRQRPKPGHVIYRIKYIKNKAWIYNGAYQIPAKMEAQLIKDGKLTDFLLKQIATQLK